MSEQENIFQMTAASIVKEEFEEPAPIVESLMEAGEVVLFIAQEKQGKSTLVRQLALDVCRGEPFLGRFATVKGSVLHIDYENRPRNIKKSLVSLNGDGAPMPENFHIRAYRRLVDRDVGFDDSGFDKLVKLAEEYEPRLLIIDPLRLALGSKTELVKDKDVTELIVRAQLIVGSLPSTTLVLVHHLRKGQEDSTPSLHLDPRQWISRIYGGQSLLATAESIIGLEEREDDVFTLATIQRNLPSMKTRLQREVGGLRFELCDDDVVLREILSESQQILWSQLGNKFSRTEAAEAAKAKKMSKGVSDNMVSNALKAGIIRQPEARGPFFKATVDVVDLEGGASNAS